MSLEKTIRYFLSIDRFFQRNQTGTPMKQSGFYLFPEVELYGGLRSVLLNLQRKSFFRNSGIFLKLSENIRR
ncbi:hypothetical protein LEP1GSC039_0920 [Leptospira santarosai str. 2000027870]|uniref:hypothetical protein n=1 Tax=Leptospira santarosai TaxID=28183 RepID=UPI0002BF6B96|nr:hypothetical protein [Leptospira santarosai]EMM87452.1 hypothetical protein LEP1GSC039_0920 [Leptospira santarosai str. 2000027870]